MLCTYLDERNLDLKKLHNLKSFIESIIEKDIKINLILAHGGGKYFSNFQNYTFHRKNILLDLSFTYMRYLDTEIEELILNDIAKNNRYISFVTDWPDYSFKESIDTLNKHNYLVKNDDFFQNFLYNNAYEFLNSCQVKRIRKNV